MEPASFSSRNFVIYSVLVLSFFAFPIFVFSEEAAVEPAADSLPVETAQPSSKDLVRDAWAASSKSKWDELNVLFDQCIKLYGEKSP